GGDPPSRLPILGRQRDPAPLEGRLLPRAVHGAGRQRRPGPPSFRGHAAADERGAMTASFLDKLKKGLARTREVLNTPVEDVVRGRRLLDAADLEAVEEALIAADLGVAAAREAVGVLRERSGEIAGGGADALRAVLREEIQKSLERPPLAAPFTTRPWVVFV